MSEEPNDDHIANLIRLAGPRTRVSDERAARVRENVRDEWMRATRRDERVRMLSIAATIAVVVLGSVLFYQRSQTVVAPAARIVATGSDVASLDWNGVTLRLDKGTTIRFLSDDAIALDRGALYFEGSGARREVRTPFGAIRDVGTQYEARVDDSSLRIRVREGKVAFRNEVIESGNELLLRNDAIERHAIARSGNEWTWVESAAPPIRLEGMRLRDALARVAREKGLALDDVPNGDVTLHGDVPLSPSEALDAATAAAGVTYEIHGERLIIERR